MGPHWGGRLSRAGKHLPGGSMNGAADPWCSEPRKSVTRSRPISRPSLRMTMAVFA
jgi:hypothetical protein